MKQPLVSVVIPAYNCQKTIAKTIETALQQDFPGLEVIVVDDGSTDKTPDVIRSFKNARYVFQPNAGPASARNRGAKESQGETIFFTDSDCVPHRNWISTSMKGFGDPSVAVVAGSYGIFNQESLLARCIHQEIVFRHHRFMPKHPKSFGSYNFGIRKEVFEKVGGFDTTYRYASGEDNDLAYRLLKAGCRILFEPKSLVDHIHTSSVKKYLHEQYRHGYWRVKMYQHHPDMMKGDDYTFWKDVIEPPLAMFFIASPILFYFWPNFFGPLFIFLLGFFIILQCFYSFFFVHSVFGAFFYAGVLCLRTFARTFGFTTGLMQFPSFQHIKKGK